MKGDFSARISQLQEDACDSVFWLPCQEKAFCSWEKLRHHTVNSLQLCGRKPRLFRMAISCVCSARERAKVARCCTDKIHMQITITHQKMNFSRSRGQCNGFKHSIYLRGNYMCQCEAQEKCSRLQQDLQFTKLQGQILKSNYTNTITQITL